MCVRNSKKLKKFLKNKYKNFIIVLVSVLISFELIFYVFDKYYLEPKKIPEILFQQINLYSDKVHHLRKINTDKEIMLDELKKNTNYLIYDEFLKFDKQKINILIQGDSWIESLRIKENKDYLIKKISNKKFGFINSGTASYSPSTMSVQQNILKNDFNINPDILIAYIDQTDIGDELCRYKDNILTNTDNNLIISYKKKEYDYFNNYFFLERQKIIRSEKFNIYKFIKLIIYAFEYNISKTKLNNCPIEKILAPLNKIDQKNVNYFIKTIDKLVDTSKKNKIKKVIFITHPHKNHFVGKYSFNVSDFVDLYLENKNGDNYIKHYYLQNVEKYTNTSIFRENDPASHLSSTGYENFINNLVNIIKLETN